MIKKMKWKEIFREMLTLSFTEGTVTHGGDQSGELNRTNLSCLCLECNLAFKCDFALSVWAAKARANADASFIAANHSPGFHPSVITYKCDKFEPKVG